PDTRPRSCRRLRTRSVPSRKRMARALVTGASGFVGNALTRALLRAGHEVHVFLRQHHNPWRIDDLRDHLRVHTGDLADEEAVRRAVKAARPEQVFHLATYGAYSSQSDWRAMLETTVRGTGNLLHAWAEVGAAAFVNTGSSSEYGFKAHAPAEFERVDPNSYYAVMKATATLLCQLVARQRSVPV